MRLLFTVLLFAALLATRRAPEAPTVFLVGDSTMADKPDPERNPERGWGQLLPRFLDARVRVRNFAVNGRSTRSFIDEGRWRTVVAQLDSGDYVLVQFGHNDQKVDDPARYTNPHTGYRRNLERFVAEVRGRGATPVLFSPIVRRTFDARGALVDTHGAYPLVVRQVARETGTAFVDLQLLSEELVREAGPEASKRLYVWTAPGAVAMYPTGRQDDTHLSVAGATAIARLAIAGMADAGVPLAAWARPLPVAR